MTSAVSILPKGLVNFILQPITLAVTASLGLHGFLWVTSPFIPLDESEAATGPLTVGVVQLDSAELSRLPQDATALFNPTATPLTPSTSELQGSLPPIPALPPPPNDIFGTIPSLQGLSSLPSLPYGVTESPPIFNNQLPPPPLAYDPATVDPSQFSASAPLPPPEPIALTGGNITLPSLPPAGLPELPPYNPADPSSISPNLTTPSPSTSLPDPGFRGPLPQAAIDHLRELQRLKSQNPGTTLDPTLPQDAQRWLARVGGNATRVPLETVPYPKAACPQKGYATVTVTVNPQGQISRPEITKSSGIPEFDDLALNAAKNRVYTPSSDGQSHAYWIPFDFDPSAACGLASPSGPTSAPESGATSSQTPSSSGQSPAGSGVTPTPASVPSPTSEIQTPTPTSGKTPSTAITPAPGTAPTGSQTTSPTPVSPSQAAEEESPQAEKPASPSSPSSAPKSTQG